VEAWTRTRRPRSAVRNSPKRLPGPGKYCRCSEVVGIKDCSFSPGKMYCFYSRCEYRFTAVRGGAGRNEGKGVGRDSSRCFADTD